MVHFWTINGTRVDQKIFFRDFLKIWVKLPIEIDFYWFWTNISKWSIFGPVVPNWTKKNKMHIEWYSLLELTEGLYRQ